MSASIERSAEFWTVAYFLSRCGNKSQPGKPPQPPVELNVETWKDAYDQFFNALGAGRTQIAFRSSLKNARDSFDGHLGSGRIGWRSATEGREPEPLSTLAEEVVQRWATRSDDELWSFVERLRTDWGSSAACDLSDGPADRAAAIVYRIIRDTELARRVKRLHGFRCQLCGSSITFEDGFQYAEAHHLQPLGEPHGGPDVMGNIVCVCPNHHAQLDYGVILLSIEHLRSSPQHSLDTRFIDYHNREIYRGGVRKRGR